MNNTWTDKNISVIFVPYQIEYNLDHLMHTSISDNGFPLINETNHRIKVPIFRSCSDLIMMNSLLYLNTSNEWYEE